MQNVWRTALANLSVLPSTVYLFIYSFKEYIVIKSNSV